MKNTCASLFFHIDKENMVNLDLTKCMYNTTMYDDKKKAIINRLLSTNSPLTSSTLSFEFNISTKTVLKYINMLDGEIRKHGATIDIRTGQGITLKIVDQTAFDKYLSALGQSTEGAEASPNNRIIYLLSRLTIKKDYVSIYELADELYVSPSSMRKLLKELSKLLERYNLKLVCNHRCGYLIVGEESDIRNCLVKEQAFVMYDQYLPTSHLYKSSMLNGIHDEISKSCFDNGISLTDESVTSLTMHILIAVNRAETNNPISLQQSLNEIVDSSEYHIAKSVGRYIDDAFGISLSDDELAFFAIHIMGKKKVDFQSLAKSATATKEAVRFYDSFIHSITSMSGIDFYDDKLIKDSLLSHIIPFLTRLKNDMQISKSTLLNIKDEFPYANELAVYGLAFVHDRYGKFVTDEETMYFALYLALALEQKKISDYKYNVAVLLDNTPNVFKFIAFRLTHSFAEYTNLVRLVEYKDYNEKDIMKYDVVLNASGRQLSFPIPSLSVEPLISNQDILSIAELFNGLMVKQQLTSLIDRRLFIRISACDKADILNQQIAAINSHIQLPNSFTSAVLERETLQPTDFNNKIAVPHPLKTDGCPNFISICCLNKPIVWNTKPVQLVFLICISNNKSMARVFFERISKLVHDEKAVKHLIDDFTYDDFIEYFSKLR